MLDNTDEIYQKEYAEAAAKLEAAEAGQPEAITEPEAQPETVEATEPAKLEAEEAKQSDPLEELRIKLEKAERSLKDTQAWGTKNAQRLAEIERDRERREREETKPGILEANPDLEDAIRYVTSDPAPQRQMEQKQQEWQTIVATAHPGIFDVSIDPELEAALVAKREILGDAWYDPLVAIREITAEKLAFTERQVGKRFAIESQKQAQKSAMSVPGAGGSASRTTVDPEAEAVQRISKMSDAEFAAEVRRVKGY